MGEINELKELSKRVQYEGYVEEAKGHLTSGNLEAALSATTKARQYLTSDGDADELDGIVTTIEKTREQAKKDRQEQARREDQERARAAEIARLKAQKDREEEQQRQREEAQKKEDQRKRAESISWVIGSAVLVAVGIWFIVSMGGFDGLDFGSWFEPKIPMLVVAFCITGMIVGVGAGSEGGGMGGAFSTAALGIAFIVVIAIAYVIQTGRIIDGILIIPIIMVGLWIPALIVALISGAAAKAGRS